MASAWKTIRVFISSTFRDMHSERDWLVKRVLPPTPRPANIRKVDELPFHVLEVAKLKGKDDPASPYWDKVADLFTELQFLEAKAEADPEEQA